MAKVLVVDDSIIMRQNLKTILTNVGHTIVGEAANGLQGVTKYGECRPDIVTMDITMPGMNGVEAVKKIIESYPDAKIVMISALGQQMMVLDALQSGAKHYILKPIEPENVVKVIKEVMAMDSGEIAQEQEEPVAVAAPSPSVSIDEPPYAIENINGRFIINMRKNFNPVNYASIDGIMTGLLFVKPLDVVFNFDEIEYLQTDILNKMSNVVSNVLNAGGKYRLVSKSVKFVNYVKNLRIKGLEEFFTEV